MGLKKGHIRESIASGKVSEEFHVQAEPEDLYDYVRLEDIAAINAGAGMKRIEIIAADGPANYMRQILKCDGR